jgi:hypothetical protein
MAVTQVSICNLALIRCGAARISSISQDTKTAVALNAIWDMSRDIVMAAHPWNFAIKRDTLAPTATTPEYGYDYEYDLPSDCLRLLREEDSDVEYVVEDSKILSDESELIVSYIYRNENENSWSPGFANALAWYLVVQIGFTLTQQTKLVESAEKAYKLALAEARYVDASEGTPEPFETIDWVRSRR